MFLLLLFLLLLAEKFELGNVGKEGSAEVDREGGNGRESPMAGEEEEEEEELAPPPLGANEE